MNATPTFRQLVPRRMDSPAAFFASPWAKLLRARSYNSCRDRHCPKCQSVKRAQWLERRLERLLPVEHFHVVFTLPAALHPLVLHHPRRLYDLLFQAASQTLLTLAADRKRLEEL